MEDFRDIIVVKGSPQVIVSKNPTSYQLIGKGKQGAVFRLSPKRCVKIYPQEEHAAMEQEVLRAAKGSQFFPVLYEWGKNYTVMEYIEGQSLYEHLKEGNKITKEIVQKLLLMLKEREQLGIPRRDANLRHVITSENNGIKVIDHVNSYRKKRRVPRQMVRGLEDMGVLKDFLSYVKILDEAELSKWEKDITIGRYIKKYQL
ncbi:hypothetical protein [Dethiobacter alkaliphilus]|uniref:Serine/threonine protein kinase n=1 Tax=Dethiobacter alkaliphilus AHT 1 TaxID=555088 RepID=C0GES8_DETAL|nr:hypothetical protein [Dethiobacter alkaliphilus]EEG78110.1 conserved hypothetical protein [Dethiobacter alkaliphilus AHT 1]